jgi:hypothetical protein
VTVARFRGRTWDDNTALAGIGIALLALPIAINQMVPGASGIVGLAIAVALLTAAFLLAPVKAISIFAAFMLLIETLIPYAGTDIRYADEVFVIVASVITLATRWRVIVAGLQPVRDGSVAVLLIAAVVSSLASGAELAVWLPGLPLLAKGIAVFYIVRFHHLEARDVRWMLRMWLTLACLVLLGGLVQLAVTIVGGTSIPTASRGGIPVVSSLFYHPQLFGWLMATAALFLIAHYVVFRRWWMLALAMVFSIGVILSGRRRSILAVAGGLAAGALVELIRGHGRSERFKVWLAPVVGVAIIAIAFLPVLSGLYALTWSGYVDPVTGNPSRPVVGIEENPNLTPARIALYEGSIEIARDHFPLGVGLGRYGSWLSRIHYSDVYRQYGLDEVYGLSQENPQFITDTFWPQILGETGFIGLVAYGVFLGWLGLRLIQLARRQDVPPAGRAVVLAAGMVFAQTLVESLASVILASPSQVYRVMLTIGGTISWTSSLPDTETSSPREVTLSHAPGPM